jgi:hypothetical protein
MFYPLDIFKTDSDGSILWRGAVETFVAARARIHTLALSSPGEYLIFDQYTGQRILVAMPAGAPGNKIRCEMKIDLRE